MKNLQTISYEERQQRLSYPSEKRALLLLNEREIESSTPIEEGGETFVSYEYDGIFLDVEAPNEASVLKALKAKVTEEIEEHDKSDKVNSFKVNGKKMWMPKETRVGLANSINVEKNAGKSTTVMWFGNEKFELSISYAMNVLSELELYAINCYNTTATHKANVSAMENIEEIAGYDYTNGYPEKLSF